MFENQCVETYSQTQDTIPSSSGESEFCGISQAAAMGLGMKGVMKDSGAGVEAQVNTDSSAAKSIRAKGGAGRVRHIEVRELSVQDRVVRGEFKIVKVKGEDNVANGFTKHVPAALRRCVSVVPSETVLVCIVVFSPNGRWRRQL